MVSYPGFDWLRFVLASVVVLGHADFQFAPFLSGGLAVQVFFALSGWLIGGILLRSDISDLPRFFFNRATRIWLPYALALGLLYGFAMVREGVDYFWFKYLILDATFTHQLYTFFPLAKLELPLEGSGNQFWSISVEEQFYLIAPLIMYFVLNGKLLAVWLSIAVFTMALGSNAAPISLGVCAAILERDYAIADRHYVRLAALSLALLSAATMWIWDVAYLTHPIFAVATVVATAVPGRRNSIAIIAGGLSYPMYLNHWIAVFAVHFVQKRWLYFGHGVYVVADYLVALGVALCLYWFFDREIQRRRNDWYSPGIGRRLALLAYGLVAVGVIVGAAMHLYGPHAVLPN